MNISLIHDGRINADKTLIGEYVDADIPLETFEELAVILTKYHFCPATFNECEFKESFSEKAFAYNNGLVKMWKYKANAKQIGMLCFDFDNGLITSAQVHQQVKHLNHIIAASKSHLVDKQDGRGAVERFHLFLPLSQPITDVSLYKYICHKVADKNKWQSDNNVMEASRYFYKHKSILFAEYGRADLSVYAYGELYKLEHRRTDNKRRRMTYTATIGTTPFEKTKAYKMLASGELNGDGDRYSNSNYIIGVMLKCGLNLDDALTYFDKFASYGDSFTRDSVERRYSQWQ